MSNAGAASTKKDTGKATPSQIGLSQLAERLEVDPRILRKWLRSNGKGLGERGKRYVFSPQQANELAREWKAVNEDEDEG